MREPGAGLDCCGLKQQRFYVPRQKRLEIGGRSGVWKALVQIGEVRQRVDSVRAAGNCERVEVCAGVCSELGVDKQPCASPNRHHAVILPISGKKLKFTIASIPFTADAYARSTASNALMAAWCMLRSSPAL